MPLMDETADLRIPREVFRLNFLNSNGFDSDLTNKFCVTDRETRVYPDTVVH